MKMNTLIEALELLRATKHDDPEALHSIDEQLVEMYGLRRTVEEDHCANVFGDECYVVCASAAVDLMNIATYDIYGKLARDNCPVGSINEHVVLKPLDDFVKFDDYKAAVKQQIDCIHGSIIEVGYDIVSDLWFDNEKLGDHNDDGTFRHDILVERQEQLKQLPVVGTDQIVAMIADKL